MTDEHAPEGRTAHECFELSRIALDQAEQVVNRATTTLECAKAQASASIAIGWARLGDALANEPRELEPVYSIGSSETKQAMGTHRFDGFTDRCPACRMTREEAAMAAGRGQICRPGPHWAGPIPIKLPADIDPAKSPWHLHTSRCQHAFIRPMEPCDNGCGATPGASIHPGYCPATCPEPAA